MGYLFLILLVILQGVFSDDVVLTELDSSFVIHGEDLVGSSLTVATTQCDECRVAIAGEMTYGSSKTFLQLKDSNTTYGADDLPRGTTLYMVPPIAVSATNGSNSKFALTFTLVGKGQTLESLHLFKYSVFGIDTISTFQSWNTMNSGNVATTIVAPLTEKKHPFVMIGNYSVTPGCRVDLFTGGLQTMKGIDRHQLITLRSTTSLASSPILSTGLTYVVPTNCVINMTLRNEPETVLNLTVAPGMSGFLMSPEYPGSFDFNLMPGTPTVTTLSVQGGFFANITFEIVGVDAGEGGSLTFKSDVEQPIVLTNMTTKFQGNLIGGRFTITWSPGKAPRSGYLLRYTVKYYNPDPTVRLIQLSPIDSSFAIHGSRLVGKSLQLTQKDCTNCTITVVAQIYNLTTTSILLSDAQNQYSVADFYQKTVSLTPPAVAMGLDNSTTNYVLTFTLVKPGQTLKAMGYNEYLPLSLPVGGEYVLQDYRVDSKTKATTMVAANNYSMTAQLQLEQFYIAPGCSIDVFAGGIQTMDGKERYRVTTLRSDTKLATSIIRSTALTYIIPPSCFYNITVNNADMTFRTSTVSVGQTGFLMSIGYPGTMGWGEPGESMNTTHTYGTDGKVTSLVNITFEIQSIDAGVGGSLSFTSDAQTETRYTTSGKAYFSMIGSTFKIDWSPGTTLHSGYLVRYTVAQYIPPPATRLVVLSKEDSSFVIYGNRTVGKILQISQTDCPDCTVCVVAQINKENGTFIQLKDAKNTFSVSDISRGHSVSLLLPASVTVFSNSSEDFVLTFTLLQPGQTLHSLGIDLYSPLSLPYDLLTTISNRNGSSKTTATTVAATNAWNQPPNIMVYPMDLPSGCTVEVYTGGVQSINGGDKHHVATMTSSTNFVPSIVRSTALTFITPPNCTYSALFGSLTDYSGLVPVSFGQTGFLMSSGYPGQIGYKEIDEMWDETTKLVVDGGKSANFTLNLVAVNDGRLIVNNKTYLFDQDNTILNFQGNQLSLDWKPTHNTRGYLIRYTVSEESPSPKKDKSSSLRSIFQSMTIVLIVWCL